MLSVRDGPGYPVESVVFSCCTILLSLIFITRQRVVFRLCSLSLLSFSSFSLCRYYIY
ncbi:hypothetical protein V1520DRAFT_350318 [Lipomyces starkeyi]